MAAHGPLSSSSRGAAVTAAPRCACRGELPPGRHDLLLGHSAARPSTSTPTSTSAGAARLRPRPGAGRRRGVLTETAGRALRVRAGASRDAAVVAPARPRPSAGAASAAPSASAASAAPTTTATSTASAPPSGAGARRARQRVVGVGQRQRPRHRVEQRGHLVARRRTARRAAAAGRISAGMNCTAWNSVRANALTSSPSAIPSTALRDRQQRRRARRRAAASSPRSAKPTTQTTAAWTAASSAEGDRRSRRAGRALASGSVISRSSVPVVRSRSIAIEVTRNMTMNGNSPHSGAPIALERRAAGRRRRSAAAPAERRARRAAARSCAGRGGSASSTRWAVASVTRALTPPPASITARNARPRSCSPVRSRSACGVVGRASPPRASAAAVAFARLVHHVARDEQRRARRGQLVERLPQLGAQHRIQPDRGLVEHQHARAAEQRAGERDARALAARQRADELPARRARPTVSSTSSTRAAPTPTIAREVAQVLVDA